jgi:hypothetical protein
MESVNEKRKRYVNYEAFIQSVKERIQNSQIKASISVNKELIYLYWDMHIELLKLDKRQSGEMAFYKK